MKILFTTSMVCRRTDARREILSRPWSAGGQIPFLSHSFFVKVLSNPNRSQVPYGSAIVLETPGPLKVARPVSGRREDGTRYVRLVSWRSNEVEENDRISRGIPSFPLEPRGRSSHSSHSTLSPSSTNMVGSRGAAGGNLQPAATDLLKLTQLPGFEPFEEDSGNRWSPPRETAGRGPPGIRRGPQQAPAPPVGPQIAHATTPLDSRDMSSLHLETVPETGDGREGLSGELPLVKQDSFLNQMWELSGFQVRRILFGRLFVVQGQGARSHDDWWLDCMPVYYNMPGHFYLGSFPQVNI